MHSVQQLVIGKLLLYNLVELEDSKTAGKKLHMYFNILVQTIFSLMKNECQCTETEQLMLESYSQKRGNVRIPSVGINLL